MLLTYSTEGGQLLQEIISTVLTISTMHAWWK